MSFREKNDEINRQLNKCHSRCRRNLPAKGNNEDVQNTFHETRVCITENILKSF